MLGKRVIQAKEVAVLTAFTGKVGVAAIVVWVKSLSQAGFWLHHHPIPNSGVGKLVAASSWRKIASSGIVAIIEFVAVCIAIRHVIFADVIVRFRFGVVDDIGRMVNDNVEENFHAA